MNTKRINECTIYYSPNFNFPMGLKIPILLSIHDLVFLEVPRFTSPLGRYIDCYMLKEL